jgi:hypothetical protein
MKYNYFVYEEKENEMEAIVFWYGAHSMKTFLHRKDAEEYAKRRASEHGHNKTFAVGQFICKYQKTPAQIEKLAN